MEKELEVMDVDVCEEDGDIQITSLFTWYDSCLFFCIWADRRKMY